jgi:hypothetical protein
MKSAQSEDFISAMILTRPASVLVSKARVGLPIVRA